METIGQRIRRLRLDRGIDKQADIAKPAGITQSTLSDIESKNKSFSATVLYALAKELGVSTDEIMFGSPGEEVMGQAELVRIFIELTPDQREMVLQMVRGLQSARKANSMAA